MLADADKIPPYERQMLLVFKWAMENSHELNQTQKTLIEDKLQQIVNVWTKKNFV